MAYARLLRDSVYYTWNALWGHWKRWLALTLAYIIFPFYIGYLKEIMQGKSPAPDFKPTKNSFIDGLKIFGIYVVYTMYFLMVTIIFSILLALVIEPTNPLLIAYVTLILVITMFFGFSIANIAAIHYSRFENFRDTLRITRMFSLITQIGWLRYFGGIIILVVIGLCFLGIFGALLSISIVGFIPYLFFLIPLNIVQIRFITQMYDYGVTSTDQISETPSQELAAPQPQSSAQLPEQDEDFLIAYEARKMARAGEMKCPNCGMGMEATSQECRNCGYKR